MNYEEFRCWRDRVLEEKSLLRLDCMNPAKAMDHMLLSQPMTVADDKHTLAAVWRAVLGIEIEDKRLVIGTGVRDFLRTLFEILPTTNMNYWLPRDVYPVYWDLLGDRTASAFNTLPAFDMSFLDRTGQYDCVLIPSPLSPTGRSLSEKESSRLLTWLESSPSRLLILDGVYNLEFPIENKALAKLIINHRCITLYSTSKSWLAPQTAGIAIVSPTHQHGLLEGVNVPDESQQCLAISLLLDASEIPAVLQRRYHKQWIHLKPQIQCADPNWEPPQTGYFSIINAGSQQLCDAHNILSVPASVFGSNEAGVSVITCLFDIKEQDLRE